jgi:hypothetical protein
MDKLKLIIELKHKKIWVFSSLPPLPIKKENG